MQPLWNEVHPLRLYHSLKRHLISAEINKQVAGFLSFFEIFLKRTSYAHLTGMFRNKSTPGFVLQTSHQFQIIERHPSTPEKLHLQFSAGGRDYDAHGSKAGSQYQ